MEYKALISTIDQSIGNADKATFAPFFKPDGIFHSNNN